MMVDDLFEGGHKDKSALENSPKEIQTRSAHGMAKSSPASAVADLKKLCELDIQGLVKRMQSILHKQISPNNIEEKIYK